MGICSTVWPMKKEKIYIYKEGPLFAFDLYHIYYINSAIQHMINQFFL